MKAFSITGWSGSGKTTLIERLIVRFRQENLRVAAFKRVPQKYYLEPESSDSFRFLRAGAERVGLVASREMLTMQTVSEETDIFDILVKRYSGCDFLLFEGLRGAQVPMIEVFDTGGKNPRLKMPVEELSAVVSDRPLVSLPFYEGLTIPNFGRDAIDGIADFMEVFDER